MRRLVASVVLALSACGPTREPAPSQPARPAPAVEERAAGSAAPEPVPEPVPESPLPEPARVTANAIVREGAPSARMDHVAVAAGRHLVIWGGDDAYPSEADGYAPVEPHALASGGRYDLVVERWLPVSRRRAPAARYRATALQAGRFVLVWGGLAATDRPLGDGGRYDPDRDRWLAVASQQAPSPRAGHTLVWTGDEALIWGGAGPEGPLADGARYDPDRDRWQPIPKESAPTARHRHSAVWTGRDMIVWGGTGAGGDRSDGARFDAAAGRWIPLPSEGAPSARHDHVAVWTGDAMIVWGGAATTEDGHGRSLADGAIFDPATNRWRPVGTERAFARADDRGVWNGQRLIVLGEVDDERELHPPPSLGLYDPASDEWSYFALFASLDRPLVLGDGELIFWGGHDGTNMMAEGLRIPLPPQPMAP